MDYPKITIITPSYNQGEFLEETIVSVLSQNYPNLEYFIVDGGSTDQSVEIIKKYESQITWWVSEKDKGQTDALNKGFSKATGDIISWINSDDYLAPHTLHTVAAEFVKHKCLAVCGPITIFDSEKKWPYAGAYLPGESFQVVIGKDYYNQPGTFVSMEAVREVGLLDPCLHYVMDKEWWIRFLIRFGIERIVPINQPLAFHRYHDASKTISQTVKFMTEYAIILYELCLKTGNRETGELFRDKYDLSGHSYQCKFDTSSLTKADVQQLVGSLLIRRFNFKLDAEQYAKGRRLIKGIDWSSLELDEKCTERYNRLKELTRYPGWFWFRVAHKLGMVRKEIL